MGFYAANHVTTDIGIRGGGCHMSAMQAPFFILPSAFPLSGQGKELVAGFFDAVFHSQTVEHFARLFAGGIGAEPLF